MNKQEQVQQMTTYMANFVSLPIAFPFFPQ